jgi:hypothetical protein
MHLSFLHPSPIDLEIVWNNERKGKPWLLVISRAKHEITQGAQHFSFESYYTEDGSRRLESVMRNSTVRWWFTTLLLASPSLGVVKI